MFKCNSCKDTGTIPLFSSSKPCLDCPPPPYPEFDEVVDIIEHNKKVEALYGKLKDIKVICTDCGYMIAVFPGTFGYDHLMDKNCFRGKCPGCGLGDRIFTRI